MVRAVVALLFLIVLPLLAHAEKRVALVIGNSAYKRASMCSLARSTFALQPIRQSSGIGWSAGDEEAAAVDHSCGGLAKMVPRELTKIWWVPEELNLKRVLGSPPLPLGYASVVPSAGSEPALSAL